MSSEAQNLMIEVIDAHAYNGADRGFLGEHRVEYCICGWSEEGDGVHTAHVASEVDKALGQRPQPDSLPTGRRYLMSDVVERAKAALVDYEVAKGSRVAVAPGRSYRLLAELVAEVERLRPRGVETTADLEWLPEDSVILTHDGGTLQKTSRGTWYWANDDQDESLPGDLIDFLPARVLYIPTDSLEEA